MTTNEIIVKVFYEEYFRSPKVEEFEALGGRMANVRLLYGSYINFIEELNYPSPYSKSKTFELVNARTGDVVFTGVPKEIAEFIGMHRTGITRAAKYGRVIKEKYIVRYKPFYKKKLLERITEVTKLK